VRDQALAKIKKHLVDFIGIHTWEELVREWLLRASGKNILPFLPDQIGSICNREVQIDVAGVSFMDKILHSWRMQMGPPLERRQRKGSGGCSIWVLRGVAGQKMPLRLQKE